RHASWRARSVPTVVLPEPMNPARQTIDWRGAPARRGKFWFTIPARTKLIAPQDANCTTEGRELDFSKAAADAAEKPVRIFGSCVTDSVRVRLEKCFGAVIQSAEIGFGV